MDVCLRQLVLIMGSPKALYGTSPIRHLYQWCTTACTQALYCSQWPPTILYKLLQYCMLCRWLYFLIWKQGPTADIRWTENISEYMIAYQLVINDEKTQLVVVASRQTRDLVSQVRLQSENHPITQSSTAKLLGAVVSQDAKWRQHIMKHNQSLISQLSSRLISRKDWW